jgi:hypothetical protein
MTDEAPAPARPTARPHLETVCVAARHGVDRRLRVLGLSWTWLAERIEARGVASAGVVQHWKRGLSQQIGCGVYLTILEELDAAERLQERRR